MSLAEQLDAIRAGAAKRVPPEQRAIMAEATDALRKSGILDGVPKAGDRLPDFTLHNADGDEVLSRDLLMRGPLVLTFFRGTW
jgi:hypothetical protein